MKWAKDKAGGEGSDHVRHKQLVPEVHCEGETGNARGVEGVLSVSSMMGRLEHV